MPVIECDPAAARERLAAAGVEVDPGNTDHERWRATHAGATAVAYDDKVVVQGSDTGRLVGLLREGGGRAHVYFDGACRGNPGPSAGATSSSPATASPRRAASGSAGRPTTARSTRR